MKAFDITDPGSPVRRRIIPDMTDGSVVIHSQQDVSEILSFNRALYNAERSSSSLWGNSSWVRVASVPLVWLDDLWRKGIKYTDANDWPKIVSMLNDPDNRGFRTAPGVL